MEDTAAGTFDGGRQRLPSLGSLGRTVGVSISNPGNDLTPAKLWEGRVLPLDHSRVILIVCCLFI